MGKAKGSPSDWPPSIANWLAFKDEEPCLAVHEFPLYTDAWITGEIKLGPYLFINTIAFQSGRARPAIVLRYAMHKEWSYPNFERTNAELYHAGSPQEELAALGSLAMGVRLRAGNATRTFEPNRDPLGTPTELGNTVTPQFYVSSAHKLPSAAKGQHSLTDLEIFHSLPELSQAEARAIVRAARLYQDALWLAESEPELTWLLLVSALETAANEWRKKGGDNIARLQDWKPELYEYLASLRDSSILRTVADHIADSMGITRKFIDFVIGFIPEPPTARPPQWAQFNWERNELKKALRTIYHYRSQALHEGRPFPSPMCQTSYLDASWLAPAEIMIGLASSERGGVWLRKDIPMNLHLFEYIARNVLLKWWAVCGQKGRSR